MDERIERSLELLQQDFEESKVVRDFTYTPEGKTMLEVLERTSKNFELLREAQRDPVYQNPLREMCLDAEFRGRLKGLRWVISWMRSSPDEVQRLQKEIERMEQKETVKQVGLINRIESKIR